ncbi:MAG: hypothetical protein J6Y03_05200 [Alphaproteobacteria bacterium]|nr:hypothetical protein [Alphaproteobacteria bacterium]
MAKTAKTGEEYKVLKQKSTPKRIAKIFILIWTLFIIVPAMYISLTYAVQIKEYAFVWGVYEANDVLITQYKDLSEQVISKVDISKYVSKIDIPEIKLDKLDKVSETTQKVNQATTALSKLGVKGMDKVQDTTNTLQKQVDKVNAQIKDITAKTQTLLQTDVQAALRKEVNALADTQIKKQLGLSDATYKNFVNGKFGWKTENERKITAAIYEDLGKGSTGIFRKFLPLVDKYFKWISWGFTALLLIILLIPAVAAWWLAKKLSANFTECPYCGKVFLSKAAKFNLLKLFK